MKPIFHVLSICILVAAAAALATEPAVDSDTASRVRQQHSEEIASILDQQRSELEHFHARFAEAGDPDLRIAIQRQIQSLYESNEIRIREANLRLAQGLGLTEAAARIAADLAELKDPDRKRKLAKPLTDRQ
jgi:thermostable 8-oxoguanine DNA glycosylase